MNLNYLYNQLSKKLRNLKPLFKVIKEDFGMFRDGVQPVLTGTRCINQCIQAMGCVIDKFGLYTCYIWIILLPGKKTVKSKQLFKVW